MQKHDMPEVSWKVACAVRGVVWRVWSAQERGNACARTSRCAALVVVMPHTAHSWRSRGPPPFSSSLSPAAASAASSAESALPKSLPASLRSSSASPDQAMQRGILTFAASREAFWGVPGSSLLRT